MSVSYGGDSITFADGSVQSGAWNGFRNRIINGAMVIDQRYAGSATANSISGYTLDRWSVAQSTTGKLIVQQNAGSVTPPAGFSKYLGVTSQSAFSVGAGDYYWLHQTIEGYNIADLAWGTASGVPVTLSFWVRSSLTGSFGGSFRNSNGGQQITFSYTINVANTWEYKTVLIPAPSNGSTWTSDNTHGVQITWGLGTGSTYGSGTAGTWSSNTSYVPTGSVSIVGTNGATWYITGVQLERGSTASSFEYRPFTTELQLCQRYFQKSYDILVDKLGTTTTAGEVRWVSSATGAGEAAPTVMLPVVMRTTPTVTFYSANNGASGFVYNYSAATNTAMTGVNVMGSRGWSGGTTGFTAGHIIGYHYAVTSEL